MNGSIQKNLSISAARRARPDLSEERIRQDLAEYKLTGKTQPYFEKSLVDIVKKAPTDNHPVTHEGIGEDITNVLKGVAWPYYLGADIGERGYDVYKALKEPASDFSTRLTRGINAALPNVDPFTGQAPTSSLQSFSNIMANIPGSPVSAGRAIIENPTPGSRKATLEQLGGALLGGALTSYGAGRVARTPKFDPEATRVKLAGALEGREVDPRIIYNQHLSELGKRGWYNVLKEGGIDAINKAQQILDDYTNEYKRTHARDTQLSSETEALDQLRSHLESLKKRSIKQEADLPKYRDVVGRVFSRRPWSVPRLAGAAFGGGTGATAGSLIAGPGGGALGFGAGILGGELLNIRGERAGTISARLADATKSAMQADVTPRSTIPPATVTSQVVPEGTPAPTPPPTPTTPPPIVTPPPTEPYSRVGGVLNIPPSEEVITPEVTPSEPQFPELPVRPLLQSGPPPPEEGYGPFRLPSPYQFGAQPMPSSPIEDLIRSGQYQRYAGLGPTGVPRELSGPQQWGVPEVRPIQQTPPVPTQMPITFPPGGLPEPAPVPPPVETAPIPETKPTTTPPKEDLGIDFSKWEEKPKPTSVANIKFSKPIRTRLEKLGYSSEEINKMKPSEAGDILKRNIVRRTGEIPPYRTGEDLSKRSTPELNDLISRYQKIGKEDVVKALKRELSIRSFEQSK